MTTIFRNVYFFNFEASNRCGSRINLRALQNFSRKNDHRNDVMCRKIIDSTRSKKVQF